MNILQLALIFLCSITCTYGRIKPVNSNNIYQYGFEGPTSPSWNKTLTNVTLKKNMYLEFDVIITKDTFNKPSQLDNIFHIGSNSLNFYPAVFINPQQKLMIFKFTGSRSRSVVQTYSNLEINKLYHVNIDETQSNIQIMVNNINIYKNKNRISSFPDMNESLYVSDEWYNSADVILSNFSIITSDNPLNKAQIKNVKKYHSDINNIDIKYWLQESQISEQGIKYFINKEEMDGEALALLIYNEPQIKQQFMKNLNEQKLISLKDRLRFEIAINKLIGNNNESNSLHTAQSIINDEFVEYEEEDKYQKYKAVHDNDIFEYGFLGPLAPSYNTELTNVTIKDNIYIEFNMIVSEDEFNKPSQIDNIFHIGSKNTYYFPAAFIDTQKKQMFFRFSGHTDFDFIDVPYHNIIFNQLYRIIIRKTQSNLEITSNGIRIYYQKSNNHSTNINQTLYFSNIWNNAANVVISNFIFISSNKLISNSNILNAKDYSKYTKNVLQPIDDADSCGFKGSFEPIKNSIVDYINIKSNIYLKFNIIFNDQYDVDYDGYDFFSSSQESDDEYNDFSQNEQESDENARIFNILHIGDSEIKAFPSIYFDDKNEIMIFRFGINDHRNHKNMIEPYFKIEREKKYRVEIYKQSKRFQICINKYCIYDNTLNYNLNSYYNAINNQPIYISNPWQNAANVQISHFSVITSNNNILKGDNLQNYAYKYCLLLNGQNGQLDGIWKPNGTYNGHYLFIKKDIPQINYPFIYLFYYLKSWRIYIKPYNMSKPLNSPKYFVKCDIDTYNVLSCSKHFEFNSNISLINGDCNFIGKHSMKQLQEEQEWINYEIENEFQIPTPPPTQPPTHSPTVPPKSFGHILLDLMKKYQKYWQILLVIFIVITWCFVCVTWKKIKQSKGEDENGKAKYIPFQQQKEYQTDMF